MRSRPSGPTPRRVEPAPRLRPKARETRSRETRSRETRAPGRISDLRRPAPEFDCAFADPGRRGCLGAGLRAEAPTSPTPNLPSSHVPVRFRLPSPVPRRAGAAAAVPRCAPPGSAGLILLLSVLLLAACGSGAPRPVAVPEPAALPHLEEADRAFLVDPLLGYPLVVPPQAEAALDAGHLSLMQDGDAEAARNVAEQLLAGDPGLHPARVLRAQVAFARGDLDLAAEEVRPVVEELPGYTAARLLAGRTFEELGRPLEAFAQYRAVSESVPAAARRAEELRDRALGQLTREVADELERGRPDRARRALERLELYAPGEEETLGAAAAVARARGDVSAELEALRQLIRLRPDDRELEMRLGDLELDAGDPRRGLEIFERLAEASPGDPDLTSRLGLAKLRWRMTLLPDRVQQLARKPELERGDFATLLYWLLPSVRYGNPERARIAADILDDPRREEIARVVNLELMEVDENVHRFRPEQPVRREEVLEAQLAVLAGAEPPLACARDLPGEPSMSRVCELAARCGLLATPEDCFPDAPVSGREALELLQRTLELTTTP